VTDLPARVEDALDRRAWAEALALLDDAEQAGTAGNAERLDLLELRARAAYGNGDFEASVAAWEERHDLQRAAGDRLGAARSAAMVAMFLMIDTGLMSPVRGWLRRAERLLASPDDGTPAEENPADENPAEDPAQAVIAAVRAYERFMGGDLDGARRQAERAVELGRRLGVPAAEVIGRTCGARVAIAEGRVDEGVDQLEEIGGLLVSGEVDPLTTGMMLCELVCAAQGLGLHDMATQWTDAMDRWGRGAAFGGLHGRCRVHRAELLRVSGPGDAAEAEALGACDDLRPWMRREFGWPLAELGTIRLRRGDLDGSEEAFLAAHRHVWCPHPGLALVRLARGDVAGAKTLIDDAVAHPLLVPSKERPPFVDLSLAPLLEAQVEIAVAAGDLATAGQATESLRTIAGTYATPWLAASASLAEARTALATGSLERAVAAGTEAMAGWAEIGAPYETAVARMVLAEAHERAGRPANARVERQAALDAFEAFGAEGQAARARALLAGEAAGAGAAAPDEPAAEEGVFRLDGDTRTITFGGRTTVLRDLKGFRYLARLLADPDREFHVLDLVAVEQGTLPTGSIDVVGAAEVGGPGQLGGAEGRGLPGLDEQAREAYRRRLAEVDDDIDDARRCHDLGRIESAERDREYLIAELARAVGLGGRLRSVGSDAERARTAVARTLRYATDRLAEHLPALAAHLDNCLHTGTYCAYRPDPLAPVHWSV
jgi:tetratricopeptide (TPR) repeat protein